MTSEATITRDVLIAAPPGQVATAIASPHGLSTWLCDEATVEKRKGGSIVLKWHDGQRRLGEWMTYEPPTRLAWRVRQGVDGPVSALTFDLAADGDGTRVTLACLDGAIDSQSELDVAWRQYLDDLRTYVERGANGRFERRPMLGVSTRDVDAALAAAEGLPVAHGILLESVTPDGGAAAAGLRSKDIIVGIGESPVRDWGTLAAALGAHQAGDVVDVSYWREGRADATAVTLAHRPAHDVPTDRTGFAALVNGITNHVVGRLQSATAGMTEVEASYQSAPDEWNVKQVLAHLDYSERHNHEWLSRLAADSPATDWPEGADVLRRQVLAALPAEELVAHFIADLRETAALVLAILETDPAPPVWNQTAASLEFGRQHSDEHLTQVEQLLALARGEMVPA